jgi:hypothetical protein
MRNAYTILVRNEEYTHLKRARCKCVDCYLTGCIYGPMPDSCQSDNKQSRISLQDQQLFKKAFASWKRPKNVWFKGRETMLLVKLWSHFGARDHLRQQLEHKANLVRYQLTERLKCKTGFVSPYPHEARCRVLGFTCPQRMWHSCDWSPKDAEKTFIGKHKHTVHCLVNHVIS